MDLILWRHAEALELSDDGDDLQRPLTAKGERQAKRMAEWLNQRMARSTRVLVSPALRCQQTAQALGLRCKTLAELAPGAGFDALLRAARWPDASAPALVIGHQPTLGLTAAWLLSGTAQPWTIKKAAAWWIRGRDRDGVIQPTLLGVQSPDCL